MLLMFTGLRGANMIPLIWTYLCRAIAGTVDILHLRWYDKRLTRRDNTFPENNERLPV